jgi:hypothetical protein
MATACRFAAPLGLAPLPRSRAGAGTKSVIFSVRSTKVVQRNFVVKAASDEGPAETPEIVKAAQDAVRVPFACLRRHCMVSGKCASDVVTDCCCCF